MATGDLVSLATAQGELAAILPADQSALPALIAAASKAIRQWCKRDFYQATYDELQSGQGFSSLLTRQYPVNGISRLSISPTVVLSVSNTEPIANQRATATLTTTGDVESGLTVTGLSLYRIASGVPSTIPVLFAGYATIDLLATAITALGGGWKGTADQAWKNWATTDFSPVTGGAQNALGPGSAEFRAFVQDASAYDIINATGEIRLRNQTFDPVFALMNVTNTGMLSVFPIGNLNVRIVYNAGYATIPEDIQQACLVTIKEWLYQLQVVTAFTSESDVDWSSTLSPFLHKGLPDAVKAILQPRRSFRQF